MESVSLNTTPENGNNDKKKKGLNVLGYIVPWWAVLLVILVALYFFYEKGYLNGILNDLIKPEKELELKGPIVSVLSPASAPPQIKTLLNMARM